MYIYIYNLFMFFMKCETFSIITSDDPARHERKPEVPSKASAIWHDHCTKSATPGSASRRTLARSDPSPR